MEFKLSDKRKELMLQIYNMVPKSEKSVLMKKVIAGITILVNKQDKEFVRLLKKRGRWVNGNQEEMITIKETELDELTGEL